MGLRDRLLRIAESSQSNVMNGRSSEYVTPAEAAEIAGIRKATIYKWVKSGELRGYPGENGLRVSWKEVQALRDLKEGKVRSYRVEKFKPNLDREHSKRAKRDSSNVTAAPVTRNRRRKKKRKATVTEPFIKTKKLPKTIRISPGGAVSGPKDREQLVLVSMERRLAELEQKQTLTFDEKREVVRLTAQIREYRILIDRLTPRS